MAKQGALKSDHKTDRTDTSRQPRASHSEKRAAAAVSNSIELDRVIHERARLAIISALAVNESLTFNDLKSLLNTTDGNVSVHARKLEEAGYVTCTKSFEGRMPKTEYSITTSGRRELERYLNHMEALIHATRNK